jgi:hypothetical protein
MMTRLRNRQNSLRGRKLQDRLVREILVPMILILGLFGLVRYAMEGREFAPPTLSTGSTLSVAGS